MAMRWSPPESISRRMQLLTAGNIEPVLELLHLGAHRAQVVGHQRNAVRLLDAQFLRVADANAALRIRTDRRQHRQLVDQLRRQRSGDRRPRQPVRRSVHLHRPHQFAVLLLKVEHADVSAKRRQHIQQRSPRGIQPQRIEDQIRVRETAPPRKRKNAAEEISPGTAASIAVQCLPPAMRHGIDRPRRRSAPNARSASSL